MTARDRAAAKRKAKVKADLDLFLFSAELLGMAVRPEHNVADRAMRLKNHMLARKKDLGKWLRVLSVSR
jgi:hypothetical protein